MIERRKGEDVEGGKHRVEAGLLGTDFLSTLHTCWLNPLGGTGKRCSGDPHLLKDAVAGSEALSMMK